LLQVQVKRALETTVVPNVHSQNMKRLNNVKIVEKVIYIELGQSKPKIYPTWSFVFRFSMFIFMFIRDVVVVALCTSNIIIDVTSVGCRNEIFQNYKTKVQRIKTLKTIFPRTFEIISNVQHYYA